MKKCSSLLVCLSVVLLAACNSGSGSSSNTAPSSGWSWISGSTESNAYGAYGTQGLPSLTNTPGARYIPVSQVDVNGNFWLFGGMGNASNGASGNLNDLWQYNPTTNQWAWVSGNNGINIAGSYGQQNIPSVNNMPGGRFGSISWLDNYGNFWLFGGFGNDSNGVAGNLNDLWEFNPRINQWTWISGSQNANSAGHYSSVPGVAESGITPGGRLGGVSWLDQKGNLWLFGGARNIVTAENYNDLWSFNPATGLWTWVGGSDTTNAEGVYGVQGITSISNQPGARVDAVSWVDNSGNLVLFGGEGIDASGILGDLNDVWRYNIAANNWTWLSGSNENGAAGTYGTQGVPSDNSIPGARKHRVPLARASNNSLFWMMGGDGYGATTTGLLNDLWSYNESTNQWAWVAGSTESNAFGSYGSMGAIATGNIAGARMDGNGWVDVNGNVWIFGGSGNGQNSTGYLNDLWKYQP